MVISVKILSIQYSERYVVRRLVTLAHGELLVQWPDIKIEISEISDASTICQYAQYIFQPTLVIDEKVVCSGRYPTKEEIISWLQEAIL